MLKKVKKQYYIKRDIKEMISKIIKYIIYNI